MNYINALIIFLYGGTILTSKNTHPDNIRNSYYKESYEYINGLVNQEVTVTNRLGYSITIPSDPPISGAYNGMFVVRRVISIDHRVIESFLTSLYNLSDDPNDSLYDDAIAAIKEQLKIKSPLGNNFCDYVIHLDSCLLPSDFQATNGTLYFDAVDLVVSIAGKNKRFIHPFGKEQRKMGRLVEDIKLTNQNTFIYRISIVDNFHRYGRRYFKIAGEVYTVIPIQDKYRRCGIYVVRSSPSTNGVEEPVLIEDYYSIEDGEKELMLFKTFEEAKVDGDINLHRKKEVADQEYETQKLKLEANRIAAEEKATPDMLKKIIEIVKPMSVLLVSIFGGVKLIYSLGKAAGAVK